MPAIGHFQCPRCPHKVDCTRKAFRHDNLDFRLWCNQCRRSLFIKLWQCPCHISWHICPIHSGEPARLRAAHEQSPPASHQQPAHTTHPAPTRSTPKRPLGQGQDANIHQWLDQPTNKRAKAEPAEVELGPIPQDGLHRLPKHHLLGPKLRAKFPRLSLTAAHGNTNDSHDHYHDHPG